MTYIKAHTAEQNGKPAAHISAGAMAVLLLLAAIFYKTRLLFSDSSYIAFNLIEHKAFDIQEHRYGSFITQGVLYAGAHLHLPLQLILISYTLSFNLFYLTVICLLVYYYRQYSLAIIMACYYLLFVSDSYYWTNNEIHQAIGWMFLLFAHTLSYRSKRLYLFIALFILFAFLTLFTHPLVILAVCFPMGVFVGRWPPVAIYGWYVFTAYRHTYSNSYNKI